MVWKLYNTSSNEKDQKDKTVSILHLEDQEDDSFLVKYIISKEFNSFYYYYVDGEKDFIKILEENKIDVILSDYEIPGFSGIEALDIAKKNYPYIPFIFVTGKMGEDAAIESLLKGATDYVLKSKLERLIPAIKRVLNEAELIKNKIAADKALLESEEKYRKLIENISDVIFEVNDEGIITYISPVVSIFLGYLPEEVIGKNFIDFVYEDEKQSIIKRFTDLREEKDINNEYRLISKGGELFWVRLSTKAIFEGNVFKGGSGTIIDINKRKQAEETLVKERRLFEEDMLSAKEKAEAGDRLKTAFIRNISHEIRTPLNGIIGFGQLMADPAITQEEKEEYLSMLTESTDRLINSVTNIIDISLIVSGTQEVRKKTVELRKILDEAYQKFHKRCLQKNLDFSIQIQTANNELQLDTDPELLKKVLNYLIDNAIKFTQKGSMIIGLTEKENTFELLVKDTGIGINPEEQQTIFDHFMQKDISTTRDFEGSGLGLSIAKGLVELLGGNIWVESKKGEGSTFFFTLPIENK